MKAADAKRRFVCFHEAGHAVAARLCGLPIRFVAIDLKGKGNIGEVNSLFGETHHLHYHSIFHHLSGPLAEKYSEVQVGRTSGISSLKDVVQATLLMRRLFVQDAQSDAYKAQQISPLPNSYFNLDEVAFVTRWLNQISSEIDSLFGQSDVQRSIRSVAQRLITMGDGQLDGQSAMKYIDGLLKTRVTTVACPDWYMRLCKDNPNLGWSLEIEQREWTEIRAGISRYDA